MKRLVIIPAYNEEEALPALLARLTRLPLDFDLCLVDDGSSDGTRLWQSRGRLTVLHHACRLGYGCALQSGFKFALAGGYEQVAAIDGDGQHEPADLPRLFSALSERAADLVLGSRFLGAAAGPVDLRRRLGIGLMRAVLRLCRGPAVSDPTSGFLACRATLLPFFCSEFFPEDYPDANLLLMLSRLHFRIVEQPVTMYPRVSGAGMHEGVRGWCYPLQMALLIAIAAIDPAYRRRFAAGGGG